MLSAVVPDLSVCLLSPVTSQPSYSGANDSNGGSGAMVSSRKWSCCLCYRTQQMVWMCRIIYRLSRTSGCQCHVPNYLYFLWFCGMASGKAFNLSDTSAVHCKIVCNTSHTNFLNRGLVCCKCRLELATTAVSYTQGLHSTAA